MAGRKLSELTQRKLRSAISNGSSVLADVDHRTAWMRRLKDLLGAHSADLGGEDILSEGQRALIRRASMLELQLEMLEGKFARNDGEASRADLDLYGRTAGNLRRIVESLGTHAGRRPRPLNMIDDPSLKLYSETLNAP